MRSPVVFCMLMINNTSCPFRPNSGDQPWVHSCWRQECCVFVLIISITYQHQQMYLHVFTPHISIRTGRHKHPHYVLMWRRIHFPVNNIFVWGPGSHQTAVSLHAGDNGTIFQASELPVGWHRGTSEGRFSSCIPASQAACSSFLPL